MSDQEENEWPASSYSDAESAADLATYYRLKRSVLVRSLMAGVVAGLLLALRLPVPGWALVTGSICGVLNAYLTMRGAERLGERGTRGFVLSSFLRIGVFGIVPVAFGLRGPWWSMGCYFAGFFLPLALYAISAKRAFSRE